MTIKQLHTKWLLVHYQATLKNAQFLHKDPLTRSYLKQIIKKIKQCIQNQNDQIFLQNYRLNIILLQSNLGTLLNNQIIEQNKKVTQDILYQINNQLQIKLKNESQKLTYLQMFGYLSIILFNQQLKIQLDPQTIQKIQIISNNYLNYNFNQQSNSLFGSVIKYLQSYQVKPKGTPPKQVESEQKSIKQVPIPANLKQNKKQAQIKEQQKQTVGSTVDNIQLSNQKQEQQKYQQQKQYKSKQIQQAYNRFKSNQKVNTQSTKTLSIQNQQIFQNVQKPLDRQQSLQILTLTQQKQQKISQDSRSQALRAMQYIVSQQFSIQSLKDHCKFIAFQATLPQINEAQRKQVILSLQSLRQTVDSHTFYVKKVLDNLAIKNTIIIQQKLKAGKKQAQANEVSFNLLKLCAAMAQKKQKKLQLFIEEQIILFFKITIKKWINGKHNPQQTKILIHILYACRSNLQIYFKMGLFSMVLQLLLRNMSTNLILDYLNKIQLTPNLINQIYQRGLFNKLLNIISNKPNSQNDWETIRLWIKLAGKVCVNPMIQERFRSKELHIKAIQLLKSRNNTIDHSVLAGFLVPMCIKNQSVCEYLLSSKILQQLLSSLKNQQNNDQLYHLFFNFCHLNNTGRDYCIRIKYYNILIDRLNSDLPHSKYFYKSLGQMMNIRTLSAIFLKQGTVKRCLQLWQTKQQAGVFQSLLDLVQTLQLDTQFQELKKQNFWDCLKLFQYKMVSQVAYSYVLQTFLVLIKKGRTRQLSEPDVRSKILLKAEYSINMDGKDLALRFLYGISVALKQNFLNQRALRLLGSIMGLKVSELQLKLALDLLSLQKVSNVNQLKLFESAEIQNIVCEALPNLSSQVQQNLALDLLKSLSNLSSVASSVATIIIPYFNKALYEAKPSTFSSLLNLMQILCADTDSKAILKSQNLKITLQSKDIISKANQLKQNQKINKIIKSLDNSAASSESKLSNKEMEEIGRWLRQGKKVKMYKTDGSVSQLLLFLSSDLLQLNCGLKITEVVKQKWRLPVNQIVSIMNYSSQDSAQFKNSVFQKNSGFFSSSPRYRNCVSIFGKNNQFHICFQVEDEKYVWLQKLQNLRKHISSLFSSFI